MKLLKNSSFTKAIAIALTVSTIGLLTACNKDKAEENEQSKSTIPTVTNSETTAAPAIESETELLAPSLAETSLDNEAERIEGGPAWLILPVNFIRDSADGTSGHLEDNSWNATIYLDDYQGTKDVKSFLGGSEIAYNSMYTLQTIGTFTDSQGTFLILQGTDVDGFVLYLFTDSNGKALIEASSQSREIPSNAEVINFFRSFVAE